MPFRAKLDCDIGHQSPGHFDRFSSAISLHDHLDREGGISSFDDPSDKTDDITDMDRFEKFHPIDCDTHQWLFRIPCGVKHVPRSNGARLIDVTENNPTEDGPVGVRIPRHHQCLQSEV